MTLDQADTVLPGKTEGREITRLDMALLRNRYFKTYHEEHAFENMLLLDTTRLTADETAERLDTYIKEQIRLYHS